MKALRILNLEDSALDAELIHANLTEGGIACEMLRMQTRADFLSALEKQSFDLILSDYSLPSFDGLSALKIAQEIRPEVPFILVSGALGEERAIEALKSGATDYVLKHRLEHLVPAVHRAIREVGERIERRKAEEALRESEDRLRLAIEATELGTWDFDPIGGELRWDERCKELFGLPPETQVDYETFLAALHPKDRERTDRAVWRALSPSSGGRYEIEHRTVGLADGVERWVAARGQAFFDEAGRASRFIGTVLNITERKRAEGEIRARTRQQAAAAALGMRALAETDLSAVMDEAVALVVRTLGVEYAEVLELLPDGGALLLRAGVGWKGGLVGNAVVGPGLDSQAGYALLRGEPVIVEDLRTESRFDGPPLLHEHGVVGGVSVIIHGWDGPFGVLGAHTTSRRTFTQDDVNLLQTIANMLATAIERNGAEEQMREIKESERRRIAADLHDEALQDMAYGLQEAQVAQLIARSDGQDGARDLEETLKTIVDALRRSVEGLREAIFELRLEETPKMSISSLMESLVELNRRMSRKRYEVYLNVEDGFPESLQAGEGLVRIVQEALSNARRHSGARNVWVTLRTKGDDLCAEVSDDGRGFEVKGARGGVGTSVMRQRALDLGGKLEIEGKPGAGTVVRFRGPADRLLGS